MHNYVYARGRLPPDLGRRYDLAPLRTLNGGTEAQHFIEFNGRPVPSVKTSLAALLKGSRYAEITISLPRILTRTAARSEFRPARAASLGMLRYRMKAANSLNGEFSASDAVMFVRAKGQRWKRADHQRPQAPRMRPVGSRQESLATLAFADSLKFRQLRSLHHIAIGLIVPPHASIELLWS